MLRAVFTAWGDALAVRASTATDAHSNLLYLQACAKYHNACRQAAQERGRHRQSATDVASRGFLRWGALLQQQAEKLGVELPKPPPLLVPKPAHSSPRRGSARPSGLISPPSSPTLGYSPAPTAYYHPEQGFGPPSEPRTRSHRGWDRSPGAADHAGVGTGSAAGSPRTWLGYGEPRAGLPFGSAVTPVSAVEPGHGPRAFGSGARTSWFNVPEASDEDNASATGGDSSGAEGVGLGQGGGIGVPAPSFSPSRDRSGHRRDHSGPTLWQLAEADEH